MIDKAKIFGQCLAVAQSNFQEILYKDYSTVELYGINGVANRATRISHYCSASTLLSILKYKCLRFTDVRFLNDSTEFIEILRVIRKNINMDKYSEEFRDFILNSKEMKELEEYKQSYWKVSRLEHICEPIIYRPYTCSFSTDTDSLSMWNYYASAAAGVSVIFNHAWNMFQGSQETETNAKSKLENGVYIYRGLIIYEETEKEKCVAALLDQVNAIYEEVKENIDEYSNLILSAFKEAVNYMRCFFKPEKFKHESEYRIAIMVPEKIILTKDDSIRECGVFEKGNNLVPYIDYKLKMESIEGIVVNPFKGRDSMLELGIKELLWMKGYNNVKVCPSNIQIRKYD